ncbi:MAG: DUF192 domain-containing protein [Gemmatimonadota bacterium]|nr:DUF192 domain-containing protein [Gemmatimonadota bacterium]MDH3422660.1 DUF192 domain-containing protein [Gemmatimonadota bacterium]
MHAREDFHKAQWRRFGSVLGVWAIAFAVGACGPGDDRAPAAADRSLAAEVAPPSEPLPPAGHAWVIFGADTVIAEVAATSDERAEGLMYREDVPDGTGMLFVFPDNQVRSFWMANTYVALDIAYMDPSFRVVDIVAMEPLITESYPSAAPSMYGLEVRQGWFAAKDIRVGTQAHIVFGVLGR